MNESTLDFQQVYAEFQPKILHYLTRMVGEPEAEDLTQEVFARVYRALGSFRGESKLSTWIYRIATNAALDKLREPAFRQIAQDGLPEDPDAAEFEVEDQDVWTGEEKPTPEQQVFFKERVDCYCDFIKALPQNYRAVVALSELGELAASDIADLLGLSLDVVKIRLHRGRLRLLQELKSHCKAEDWL